jgi:hypothetical protein
MPREIVPALGLDSFSCPHVDCGAIAHQTWFKLYVDTYKDNGAPWIPALDSFADMRSQGFAADVIEFFERMAKKEVFFEIHDNVAYLKTELINVVVSRCYSCNNISIWRADDLIYPVSKVSIAPNEGMPSDVRNDFLEANEILNKSPRGAAALLRLCIQKLLELVHK